jgi:diaminopimelate epimerase
MEFSKLEALGNDFVVVDARSQPHDVSAAAAERIADRRRGVGCDQVLILAPPSADGAFSVVIRNADGSAAEQCGNGMRALAAWLDAHGELGNGVRVETAAGPVELDRWKNEYSADLPGPEPVTPAELELPPLPDLPPVRTVELLSLGNPHLIALIDGQPDAEQLSCWIAALARAPAWRNAVNVGVARVRSAEHVELRVHERGAGPTPACGSAACAAAWLVRRDWRAERPIVVEQPGGRLVVDCQRGSGRVLTRGPARVVFQGRIQ